MIRAIFGLKPWRRILRSNSTLKTVRTNWIFFGKPSARQPARLSAAASAAPNGQMAAGVVTASTPRGMPKLGDDQFASGPSPALFLGVRRGDAYVQISGAAMPDNMDAWAAAADLVRETFANQH